MSILVWGEHLRGCRYPPPFPGVKCSTRALQISEIFIPIIYIGMSI